MKMFRASWIALAVLAVVLPLPAQRGVQSLTSSGLAHTEPKLSPNGQWVAFKTTSTGLPALAIIRTDGSSKESILYSGATLTRFCWHPDNRGLYYQRGSAIEFLLTSGGTGLSVGTIPGNGSALHDIDPTGTYLVGSSFDANFSYQIWRLNTDGKTNPSTILRIPNNFIDSLVIDPSGAKIAYTSQPSGAPFAPVDIRRVDVDGKNDMSMSGGPIPDILRLLQVSRPKNLSWVDQGTTLLFMAADRQNAPWQIYRVTDTDHDPMLMTDTEFFHMDPSVHGDWLVYRGTIRHQSQAPHDHAILGLMPSEGGGRVPLEPELDWVLLGAPSMDTGNTMVAFAGYPVGSPPGTRSEIQLMRLDREVRAYPRATLGKVLNFELPVELGERGTLFLSLNILELDAKAQLSIPGLEYRVALDPAILLPVVSGTGDGSNPLRASVVVPLIQSLIGLEVYLQGMRIKPGSSLAGDFSRFVKLRFFDYRL